MQQPNRNAITLPSERIGSPGPISGIHEIAANRPEPAPPVRAAQVVIEALVAAGIDTFFGIPGGPAAPIFQALEDVAGARLIESRQESAAAFAAAGFYRSTGRVAAVVVTAGPGVTQVVTGIVNASLERIPMLLIAGDVAWAATGGRLAQDSGPDGVAIEQLLGKCTRAQVRVSRPESAASQALAALDAALDPESPGPALLVLPMQHGAAPVRRTPLVRKRRLIAHAIDAAAVQTACEILASAQRPLLVLGGGCRRFGPSVRKLVDQLDVPFVTTPGGKGVVSEEHPRSLRHGGLAASLWARAYTREGVDGCVVLGTDLDDASIGPTRYVAPGGRLVHVDLDARVFDRNLPTSLGVVADLETFADAMREHWRELENVNDAGLNALRAIKRSTSSFDQLPRGRIGSLAPQQAILELEAAAPDALFCSDIGEHMLFALHFLTAKGPDRFHIQLSLGSMGSGIAISIGLALGQPDRRVVCIAGDGCMQMMGTEVMVAQREQLPITFAVFNDGRYNMVHHGMKQLYGQARPWEAGYIDFESWAGALGLRAARIDREGAIADVLAEAEKRPGPIVLDVRIDRDIRIKGAGRVEALQQMSAHEITGGAK